ncbi:CPBP family intramembrane metalloprotease [bacterium]|nr:CPBP family intramembrane metalloprotease [bacterium]
MTDENAKATAAPDTDDLSTTHPARIVILPPGRGTHPAPGKAGVFGTLAQDLRDMLAYLRGMPWPPIRIFLTGATLILLYKFFCTKKSFYQRTVRDVFDFNHEFFGLGQRAWMYISTFVLLFVIAFLISRFVDKNKWRDMGLGLGDWRFGLRWGAIFLGVMIPVTFAVSFTDAFVDKYPLSRGSTRSMEAFLAWEFVSFLYFIGWEYYFRSYMLFSLYRYIGAVAVFVPMIPFVILHSSKPLPEALGAIFVAELLCVFALRAGSFWYGMVVHWTINTAMDVFAVWQKGGLG